MAFAVFLFVDKPVASLQFDLDTQGSISLDPSVSTKQLVANRLSDGKLRVVIFGLNQSVFSGKFATGTAPIKSITSVIGSTPDGSNAGVAMQSLSSPKNVKATKK